MEQKYPSNKFLAKKIPSLSVAETKKGKKLPRTVRNGAKYPFVRFWLKNTPLKLLLKKIPLSFTKMISCMLSEQKESYDQFTWNLI